MNLLTTFAGSMMEGFLPAGWDLARIDACCAHPPGSIGERQSWWHPTPLTNLAGFCLELFSGKGLESALLEGIGLKHKTVSCHYGAVFPKTPMATRTVPWLHGVRLPPPGHLLNGHGDGHSVPSRSLVRCVSFSLPKSGNKPNKPHASMVAGKGFAGHCSPSS